MNLQLIVSATSGNIYADAFLVIKPLRSGHDIGTICELFEKGQIFLGYGRLESVTALRIDQISDNLAMAICSQNAAYLKAILQKMYKGEQLYHVMAIRWTERNLESFKVLTQMRWDKIVSTTPYNTSYPQLSLHLNQ